MRRTALMLMPAVALIGCGGSEEPVREHSLADLDAPPKVVVTDATPAPAAVPVGTDAVDASDPDAPAAPPPADHVLTADLYGDGSPEVFVGSGADVQWGSWVPGAAAPTLTGRYLAKGMLQAWFARDLDGDGRDEVVMAFGLGRGFPEAEGRVVVLRGASGGAVTVPLFSFEGPRTQITALDVWPRSDGTFDIYVATFKDRFTVRGGVLSREGGEPRWLPGHELRMGMYRAVGDFDGDGKPETAVGRLYGDEKGSDGDLRVVQDDGTAERIQTLRGVRAVAAGDVDGDGRPELLFGDGWHKNYGKIARYRPSIARWSAGGWSTELIEESADQYAVEKIGVLDGAIVAGGNRLVTRYARGDAGWTAVSAGAPTSTLGTWAAAPGPGVLVGGAAPAWVR